MATGVAMLVGLAVGWLTLALGLLAFRAGRRWYRAWQYGPPLDHTTLLMEYGRRMAAAPDHAALRELLVAELPRRLQAERAVLLLPELHYLVAVAADGTPPGQELRLPVSHAGARWVASAGEAQLTDRGRLRELIEQGRTELDWTRVMVPLMRGADLRGLWLLGARRERLRFSPDDLRWLTALGRQAAIVLEALDHAEQERRAASEMRALYRQVVSAREAERGHLSRELHDGLLQDLCAITRDLKALAAQPDSGPSDLPDIVARSGTTVNVLRAICNDLRPPLLQHDLATALSGLVEALDARSTTPIGCDISADALSLPDDVALAIFRIAQEALHNAIRHADASEIAVRLTQYPDRLRLTITDDGRGIAEDVDPARFVARGHFGLAGMRERAAMIGAHLDVQTAVDYGTVVVLELPH
jgi:signal transduction histidine kinase